MTGVAGRRSLHARTRPNGWDFSPCQVSESLKAQDHHCIIRIAESYTCYDYRRDLARR